MSGWWALAGVTLVCYVVAQAVHDDRVIRRMLAQSRTVHLTGRGGAM